MLNIFFYFLIFIFLISIVLLFSMFKLLLIYKKNLNQLELKSTTNFMESLELATTEQLLKEIRKRNSSPFVLLQPIKEKDFNGIRIESHTMNSVSCLATIHLAKEIVIHNMKKKGEKIPQLPSLDDYFREE